MIRMSYRISQLECLKQTYFLSAVWGWHSIRVSGSRTILTIKGRHGGKPKKMRPSNCDTSKQKQKNGLPRPLFQRHMEFTVLVHMVHHNEAFHTFLYLIYGSNVLLLPTHTYLTLTKQYVCVPSHRSPNAFHQRGKCARQTTMCTATMLSVDFISGIFAQHWPAQAHVPSPVNVHSTHRHTTMPQQKRPANIQH